MTDALILLVGVLALFSLGIGIVELKDWIARHVQVDWCGEGRPRW